MVIINELFSLELQFWHFGLSRREATDCATGITGISAICWHLHFRQCLSLKADMQIPYFKLARPLLQAV